MRSLQIVAVAVLSIGVGVWEQVSHAQGKPTTPKSVFIGWVDINVDDWVPLGYSARQEWVEVIDWHNRTFQDLCRRELPNFTVTGAKSRTDDAATGHDLQVSFSGVKFDVESYRLYAEIHVVETKSGQEVARVDRQGYRGGRITVHNCLKGALEKLEDRLQKVLVKLNMSGVPT